MPKAFISTGPVTGGNAGTGAVVGGAVGGLTDKDDFDLGKPVWGR